MLLAEPQPTNFDLHFPIIGLRVRVSPFFFVMTLLLGYDASVAYSDMLKLNTGFVVLMWIGVCFVSILVHEMGHALAMRRFGIDAKIVLYHFGGLAVPTGSVGGFGFQRPHTAPGQQIFILAAGPGAQLILAALLLVLLMAGNYIVPPIHPWINQLLPAQQDARLMSPALFLTVMFALQVNIFWALLNLLPIYPLDGGQISRELFLLNNPRDGVRQSLILSIVAGIAIAIYGLSKEQLFMGMMFASLAFSSYQLLQAYSGYGGGGGGGRRW